MSRWITEKAMQTYKEAIAIDPQNRRSHFSLGMTLALSKQYREAVYHLNRVKELGPESETERAKYPISYHKLSFSALAICYERLDGSGKAMSVLEELISCYPDDIEAKKAS